MKQRIIRGGKPAVTVHFTDDYSEPIHTAWISIEVDGEDPTMMTRWKVTGASEAAEAFAAIRAKDLPRLMDLLDRFMDTAHLPALQAEEEDAA